MVKKFISACLILLYLNVTVGIAVHECGCGNSGKPELFMSEKTCVCHESVCCDSHEDEIDHDCQNHHCEHEAGDNDHDCQNCHCKTKYKSASFDGAFFESVKISLKNILFAEAPVAESAGQMFFTGCNTACYSPPAAEKPPLIYLNCQLRL